MPNSLVKNYIHIIFSTKYRDRLIVPPLEKELYQYLGGICNEMGCQTIKVGGYVDHVHVLCKLSQNVALRDLLEEMKAHSSRWAKTKGSQFRNFYWQDGYGAFSVSPNQVDRVIRYIENQHEHHRKKSFEEEYRDFHSEHGIDFDERSFLS